MEIMIIFANRNNCNIRYTMQVNTMNESQMMILESFAGAQDEQEVNALIKQQTN